MVRPCSKAPAQLRGWLGLRDQFLHASDRKSLRHASGHETFVIPVLQVIADSFGPTRERIDLAIRANRAIAPVLFATGRTSLAGQSSFNFSEGRVLAQRKQRNSRALRDRQFEITGFRKTDKRLSNESCIRSAIHK